MKDARWNEPYECECRLAAPGSQDPPFSALITYNRGQLHVVLRDYVHYKSLADAFAPTSTIPMLVGTHAGEPLTVLNLVPVGQFDVAPYGGGYLASGRFTAQLVMFRLAVTNPAFSIASCRFSFENSEEFTQGATFEHCVYLQDDCAVQSEIRLLRFPKIEFRLDSIQSRLSIVRDASSSQAPSWRLAQYSAECWIELTPDSPRDIEWFVMQATSLRLLLSILLGAPTAARAVRGTVLDEDGEEIEASVLMWNPRSDEPTPIAPQDVRFPLSIIAPVSPDFVNKWFASKASGAAADLFVGAFANSGMYGHQQFSAIVHAVEAFHRHCRQGTYMAADMYADVAGELCAHIPPTLDASHRAALKSRIRYGNEFSLIKRLTSLAKEIPPDLHALATTNLMEFLPRVVSTRNYFTHWDEGPSTAPRFSQQELPRASAALARFLALLFMLEIGLTAQVIKERWH